MPKATTASPSPPSPRPRASSPSVAAPLIAGGAFAALEIGGGIALLGFFQLGRAEALLFLALRPWLLIVAVAMASRWPWRKRFAFYALALALAAVGETVLLLALGAPDPWSEMTRGLAAGAAIALAADVLVQALGRQWGRGGTVVAVLFLLALLVWGRALRPYEALVLGPTLPRAQAATRPPLLLMTGLPIVWGTGGAFDPDSRPAETYRALEREFDVRPIDAIEPAALGRARLMLLAQPRLLAPEELVALDEWVRTGGRVLVLTDPSLVAAREFPLLDPRRPPETGLLGPLLAHWGLQLEPAAGDWVDAHFARPRKLAMVRPGRFVATGRSCRVADAAWLARCRIGRGEATLVADADLLLDAAWTAPGNERGSERHLRTADNALLVADWLDALTGRPRERTDRAIAWIAPRADRHRATVLAALAPALALIVGIMLILRRKRRKPTNLSTDPHTVNAARTKT